MTYRQPELGDFGVVATVGVEAQIIRWATASRVSHAVLFVGDGQLIEAEPHGARLRPVGEYGTRVIWSRLPLSTCQRTRIAREGRALRGTPYGWRDIVAIGLAQRRFGELVTGDEWWVKRLADPHTLICSQLCDLAYQRAGVQLFDDGPQRLPGLVSPGDLLRVIDADRIPL